MTLDEAKNKEQYAIKRLQDAKDGYEEYLTDEAIDIAIKAIEQTTWIPCSERLPNHDEYIKNNGLFNVTDGNRSYSEWFDIYDKKGFGEPTICGFRIDRCVTAWMPLPEPYKGE